MLSLDAFRGVTIAAMLLVTQAGSVNAHYAQLRHAEWIGWTFTDTIAPSFMWIVGVALNISLHKRRRRGNSRAGIIFHLGRRAVAIFGIGVILGLLPAAIEADVPSLAQFTVMGTLQRIAIAYFIAGVLTLLVPDVRGQFAAAGVFLAAYSVLLLLVPVPGFGIGDVGPESNAIGFLDQLLLGVHSARSHPLLSALPASATVLLGSVTGCLLNSSNSSRTKLILLILGGGLLFLGGTVLKDRIPIVMYIWTPSYCLVMGGIASISFAIVYWLVEIQGLRRGIGPFVVFGMNPIAMWTVSGVLVTLLGAKGIMGQDGVWRSLWTLAYEKAFLPFGTPEQASLIFSLVWVLLFYYIARVMYAKGWIIRV